jgi:endonuclease/exonuclease/phosphatase family metal-dependent hydrolase
VAVMITVASYNIRKGLGTDRLRRPGRILDVLEEIGADIVALQEADRRFGLKSSALPIDLIAARGHYTPVPFETRPQSIGWHGNAVLVRDHITILDQNVIKIPSLEPRGAVVTDLAIGEKRLRIVAMHLDLSGLWRRRQAQSILSYLDQMSTRLPTILMGDLNEWSIHGGCIKDFGKAHRIAHTGPSFHSRRPIGRLDRIMVSETIHIAASGTHSSEQAKRASDHLPIWARVTLGE